MARVLLCWEQGNGLAYIEGMAMAARLLKEAGHEVLCAPRDLRHAERLLGGTFPFYQAPTQVIPDGEQLGNPMTFADVLMNLGYGNATTVAARVRAWRNLLDQLRPDIVRCANSPGTLLAARGTGMRTLAVAIGFIHPPMISPLPNLRSWNKDAVPERMAAREAQVLAAMNQGLDAIAAPRLASLGALYSEIDRCDLYTYPELDEYGPRDSVHYLGNFQPGLGEAPTWPAGPGKRIFAYLDATERNLAVLQALAASGQPVLVYMPHVPEQLRKQYAAGKLRIVDKPIDLPRAAAGCDIGVNQGGHNIVGSFLQAGKPQLCVPAFFPDRITSERVVELGAGLMAFWRTKERPDAAEKLTRLIQEPGFALKAQEIGGRLSRYTLEYAIKGTLESVELLARPRG
jgi:UDP:flavonoid glycosyltransferase YjiC (YdhE family)